MAKKSIANKILENNSTGWKMNPVLDEKGLAMGTEYKESTLHTLMGEPVVIKHPVSDNLPDDISKQLDLIYSALQPYKAWTGSFLNYYAPEGNAGVISCEPTQGFNDLRKPQNDYFGGEVIVTSNAQTNGHSTPSDFPEINAYYNGAKPKALANHWGALDVVTIDDGAQLMSVEYRNRGDMTIWSRGRLLGTKTTPKIVVEWSNLFRRNRY